MSEKKKKEDEETQKQGEKDEQQKKDDWWRRKKETILGKMIFCGGADEQRKGVDNLIKRFKENNEENGKHFWRQETFST